MDFLLFHVCLLPGTNILRWEWEELQEDFAYIFIYYMYAYFYDVYVPHRVSQVMCLLPGSGRGIATELQSDEPELVLTRHRP